MKKRKRFKFLIQILNIKPPIHNSTSVLFSQISNLNISECIECKEKVIQAASPS